MRRILRPIKTTILNTSNRLKKGIVILIYHRVAPLADYPYPIVVSPDNFAQQMEVLRKNYHPLSLLELVEAIEGCKVPRRGVVVTFDDGYIDNLTYALPILESYQIPATVFVTTGNLIEQREFWWDELEHIILKPTQFPQYLKFSINGQSHEWSSRTPGERDQARRAIHLVLRPLAHADRELIMEELVLQAGQTRETRPDHRSMTDHELQKFSKSAFIDIGAHTVSHPILSSLPYDEQYQEFSRSKDELKAITGKGIELCSYPYGSRDDFNQDSINAVKDCGFRAACTTSPGLVREGTNLFELPRCWADNWGRYTFQQHLQSYFSPRVAD
jgi:peptidoglycan/xylan/chitin deacetylase (PgdA/CDA1 family)